MKTPEYYRERRRKNPGAHSGRSKRFLDAPEFVAWDGEGKTIEAPSGLAKADYDAQVAAIAADILETAAIAHAPYWDALAEVGGKIVPGMVRVKNRWRLAGEYVDIPTAYRTPNTKRPWDGIAHGNADLIAAGVAARTGEDVTDSDVLDFFRTNRKMTLRSARAVAEAQLAAVAPRYGRHVYTLLANSKGDYIENSDGLSSRECLTFLSEGARKYPNARHVIFSGTYDVNMMLPRDLSFVEFGNVHTGKIALARLWSGDERGDLYTVEGKRFWLGYRPRKLFTVAEHQYGPRYRLDANGNARRNCTRPMRLWDVWGFFQASFVRALTTWFTADELRALVPEFEEIRAMKAQRGAFVDLPPERIREYCFAECRALVLLMERLAACLRETDLHLARWDGVGAIGAALLRQWNVKEAIADLPAAVEANAKIAYAGGRIEQVRLGADEMDCADLRSAYPASAADLPNLNAEWRSGYDAQGFSIARVSWSFRPDLPWYPLFYRTRKGTILFPAIGSGYYWRPEVEAALAFAKLFGGDVLVDDAWTLDDDGRRPFANLRPMYDLREEWKRANRPAENILRLGPNSVYGKTAQMVGEAGKRAPFFSLAWCGWITSATRAKLVEAALVDPHAIISFSTDGIHATRPLGIVTPEKVLGTWAHKGNGLIVNAQAGVYWEYTSGRWSAKYRGFSREGMETPEPVLDAWARGTWGVEVRSERFVTLGAALHGAAAWEAWRTWQAAPRMLDLTGRAAKRMAAPRSARPDRGSVLLKPAWNVDYDLARVGSAPYRKFVVRSLDEDTGTVRE